MFARHWGWVCMPVGRRFGSKLGMVKQNRGLAYVEFIVHLIMYWSRILPMFVILAVTITYLIVTHIDSWVTVRLIEFLGKEVFANEEFKKIVASILWWLQNPRKITILKTHRTSMWANLWIDMCMFHGFLFCPCHQKQRQRHLKVQQRPGQRCRLRQRWAQDAPNACCDTGRHLRWICGQKLGNPRLNGAL